MSRRGIFRPRQDAAAADRGAIGKAAEMTRQIALQTLLGQALTSSTSRYGR